MAASIFVAPTYDPQTCLPCRWNKAAILAAHCIR